MKRLHEGLKMDLGVVAQALNGSDVTGRYHSAKPGHRILALLSGGAMAAGTVTSIELLQAADAEGGSSKGIPSDIGQVATAEIAANTKVTEMTVTLATFAENGVITINGLVFTAHGTVTTVANREFKISGDDTADAVELCLCINDATYGVPGVTASSALGVVTLVATDPGAVVITVTSDPDDGTCVKATLKAQAFVEILTGKLDVPGGFLFVACKIITTADTVVSAAVLRGDLRFETAQKVGASAVY
ncbi:hypothetical protein ES703_111152 [subsurface metagenome]